MTSVQLEEVDELLVALAGFSADPLGFVYFAFPWGQEGTELEKYTGPHQWQVDLLTQVRDGLITIDEAIRIARTSCHGIGKSALVAWLILWAISTFEDTKGVVTANTENQLKTKTWAELAKWHRLFIGKDIFECAATALYCKDPEHERTWRIDMTPWSERNTEAFAGLHNRGKRLIVIFDEASAIPDLIWEVTEGALTDQETQILWFVFGNPTRNKGRFRECFGLGKFAHRWRHLAIDSRTVPGTNLKQFQEWVVDYGEDSDFVRVRVRGIFPREDAVSFIGYELAMSAAARALPDYTPPFYNPEPVVLGVDISRFGDDATVIYPRQGLDARSRPMIVLRNMDLMTQAARIAQLFQTYHAAMIFVDAGGVGGGVVDRLRQLQLPVIEVDFGASPDGINVDPSALYANKRAEIWGALREWLSRGCIQTAVSGQEVTLVDELTGPTYGLSGEDMKLQLEKKRDMRKRGVPSPNAADALACTFAYPVFVPFQVDLGNGQSMNLPQQPVVADDYDPYSRERMTA
jgi:hypothetical protein